MAVVAAHDVSVVAAVPNLNVSALHGITLLILLRPWLLGLAG